MAEAAGEKATSTSINNEIGMRQSRLTRCDFAFEVVNEIERELGWVGCVIDSS
jgi:hypothetical protein